MDYTKSADDLNKQMNDEGMQHLLTVHYKT